ncbi:MAG TPA: TetR/AcrR family transcriptional regulator [Vicinamibacterales bacterium]|nr:TetR/AcrR family transcriptional regulator [Vicinamibacterales bacterium]
MARPPSAKAHRNVLDAALALFAERGIDGTSMDAIAGASGVSKATIYKHWRDKDALCLDVVARLHEAPPDVDSGNLRKDLIAVLTYQPGEHGRTAPGRLMPHLMAHAVRNPAFGKAWRAGFLDPPRLQLTKVLARGTARGELRRGVNSELALALLIGPMVYGHILTRIDRTPPRRLAQTVVDVFLRAYGRRPARGRR